MGEILRRTDRWGREIVLDDDCWYGHVVRRRSYFSGRELDCVGEALTAPSLVTHDVDDLDRECFYRPSPLPRPYGGLLVKVVVDFASADVATGEGLVVTVHLTPKPKPGEQQKWP
ncbi:MAG: hypothetical protein M3Q10_10800 [Chloroflexota bacterium]|nr:hypothetical protein [Chloroflexota bacterium]